MKEFEELVAEVDEEALRVSVDERDGCADRHKYGRLQTSGQKPPPMCIRLQYLHAHQLVVLLCGSMEPHSQIEIR